MRRVTLSDLACQTGLNVSTVSRALANPSRVNPKTRRLVEKAAAESGYTAHLAARSLSRGATDTIMVLAPSFHGQPISPVFTETLRGICEETQNSGLSVIIQQHVAQPIPPDIVLRHLRSGMIDGVLLFASDIWSLPEDDGRATPPPVVSVMHDLSPKGLSSITVREDLGFASIVDHLLERGHRTFAYVSGPEGNFHDTIRRRAVIERLAVHGLHEALTILPGGPFNLASGAFAAEHFLALPRRPGAAICASDALAVGFMHTVQQAGLRIPDNIAVAGFDGLEYGAFMNPALTTMEQPVAEIGRLATRLLQNVIAGRISEPQLVSLPPKMVVRAST